MAKFHPKKILPLIAAFMLCSCKADFNSAEGSDFVFDTYASYSLHGGDNCEAAALAISDTLERLSGKFQLCYEKPANELEDLVYSDCHEAVCGLEEKYGGGINVTCGALTRAWGISTEDPKVPAEEDIQTALDTIINDCGKEFYEETYFDFGAVAKGYACDSVYYCLSCLEHETENSIDYGVLSLGSSTMFYGEKPDGEPFRAGITNPNEGERLGIIETDAAFISTSGGYERYFEADGKKYSHILDLDTGRPAETDLTSVTVIVPAETEWGGIMSDYLSTAVYLGGTEELEKWLACKDFQLVAADENGIVYSDCNGFILNENSGFTYGKQEKSNQPP